MRTWAGDDFAQKRKVRISVDFLKMCDRVSSKLSVAIRERAKMTSAYLILSIIIITLLALIGHEKPVPVVAV
jgi:hypothetical protein